jgi:hypothetical protein
MAACRHRPRGKRLLVPDAAEAPDGAAVAQFEIWAPGHRLAVGEESDRIIAADGETGVQSTTIRSVVAARVTDKPIASASSRPAIAAPQARYRFRCCRAAVIVLAKDAVIRIELAPNLKRGRNREVRGAGEQPANWGT